MRSKELLHGFLKKSLEKIDIRIIRAVSQTVDALLVCRKLSVVALGRVLQRKIKVKHAIKCVDRLFGNSNLYDSRDSFYSDIASKVVTGFAKLIIIVDWTDIIHKELYCLRASLSMKGRALTLYEQIYTNEEYQTQKTYKLFLYKLKKILPKDKEIIIVTDAGFRSNWFKLVQKMGWDFVGRIRNNVKCKQYDADSDWQTINNIYESKGTKEPTFIGKFLLAQRKSLKCNLFLQGSYRNIKVNTKNKYKKGAQEPWLIATSLRGEYFAAKEIMKIYAKRMQIEESFRDIKSIRNGLGLNYCKSNGKERLSIALLIAMLAVFLLWLLGIAIKMKNLHYSFQSNTERKRSVLSNFTIGLQAITRPTHISIKELKNSLRGAIVCDII